MSLTRGLLAVLAVVLCVNLAAAAGGSFALTGENTKIEFLGTKKDGKHTGGFKKVTGKATAKDVADASTLSLDVTIDIDSLYSDDAKLTGHLKAPDFFDVKRFPTAKFVSSSVTKGKEGHVVTGELTMHGQTKKVTFPATITTSADGVKLDAKFNINRNDWGISFGKGNIADEVGLTLNVAATK